jgi:hypothetical protein
VVVAVAVEVLVAGLLVPALAVQEFQAKETTAETLVEPLLVPVLLLVAAAVKVQQAATRPLVLAEMVVTVKFRLSLVLQLLMLVAVVAVWAAEALAPGLAEPVAVATVPNLELVQHKMEQRTRVAVVAAATATPQSVVLAVQV